MRATTIEPQLAGREASALGRLVVLARRGRLADLRRARRRHDDDAVVVGDQAVSRGHRPDGEIRAVVARFADYR